MSKKLQQYLILALLALIWGSSFILMKRGLQVYTPYQIGAWRIFSAFLFFLPLGIKYIKNTPKVLLPWLAIAGLTGNAIAAFLFPLAQTQLSSSTAGVLNALVPIFALVVGIYFTRNLPVKRQIWGIVIGFVGAVTLVVLRSNGTIAQNYAYGLYIVLATFLYGISVNVVKHKLQSLKPLHISTMAILCVGLPCGIYLFTCTDFVARTLATVPATMPQPMQALGYVTLLGLFGTAISLIIFNYLVSISDALFASSVTYLIPIVALGWGIIDGEPVGLVHLIGISGIFAGIRLVNKTG